VLYRQGLSIQNRAMRIGVVDSGVGGFSVLAELYKMMPAEHYFYLSDQENAPYGNKETSFLKERLHLLTQELLKEKVDLIVVACHTATAEAIESLRANFEIPFVGIEPYLNVLNQRQSPNEDYVVLVTETTARSKRFLDLKGRLDPTSLINIFACKKLASLIESYFHDEMTKGDFEVELKAELELIHNLKLSQPSLSSAILGCTHYPLVMRQIEAATGLKTLFPGEAIARRTKERLLSLFAYSAPIDSSTNGFSYRRKVTDPWQHRPWNYLQKVSLIG